MITSCANSILRRSYDSAAAASDPTIPPPTVSSLWTSRFLKRHPELHIRKQKTLERQSKEAHHPDNIRTWFERYKAVCDEKAIQEGDRYNFDETGFQIGVGHDQWIVTLDPKRQSYLASTSNRH